MANQEEYPQISTGDVLILAPTGKSWKIHAFLLRNSSEEFKRLLDETSPIHLTKSQRSNGKTVLWKFRMEVEQADTRFVKFKAVDPKSRPTFSLTIYLNTGGSDPLYLKNYDNFFRCLYNINPDFGQSGTNTIFAGAISLLQAAEMLGAIHCVRGSIESNLLRDNQILWHHVRNQPGAWCDIAIRLQSPIMFREAMIHIVGGWNAPGIVDKTQLGQLENGKIIRLTAERKIREMNERKGAIERQLLEFYPCQMIHQGSPDNVPNRSTYAGDIYSWQALILVRQWIMSAYLNKMHHVASDGGAELYRQIGTGNAAYLRTDTLIAFHKSFDMTSKGKICLENAVHSVKEALRPLVAELLVSRLQAVTAPNLIRYPYLTNTEFSDVELPWYKEHEEAGRGDWEAAEERHALDDPPSGEGDGQNDSNNCYVDNAESSAASPGNPI